MLRMSDLNIYCDHINRRNLQHYYTSIHLIFWMIVMLDFICMVFTKLIGTGDKLIWYY